MNTKAVTAIALVAVMAVAAVGVGFAYQASTSNTGNAVETSYLKILANDTDASAADSYSQDFLLNVKWNSETDADGVKYTVNETESPNVSLIQASTLSDTFEDTQGAVKVGDIKLTISDENATFATAYDLNLAFTQDSDSKGTFYYGVQLGDGDATYASFDPKGTTAIKIAEDTTATTVVFSIYAIYNGYDAEGNKIVTALDASGPDALYSTFSLTFKATPHSA